MLTWAKKNIIVSLLSSLWPTPTCHRRYHRYMFTMACLLPAVVHELASDCLHGRLRSLTIVLPSFVWHAKVMVVMVLAVGRCAHLCLRGLPQFSHGCRYGRLFDSLVQSSSGCSQGNWKQHAVIQEFSAPELV